MVAQKSPSRDQPHIAAVVHDSTNIEYFILCEKKVICKAPNLKLAFFINFCCYYCFNLEFPSDAKGIYYFFQDFVLEKPDRSKKNATYLSVTSDIKCNIEQ